MIQASFTIKFPLNAAFPCKDIPCHCVAGVSDKYGTVGTTVDQPFLGYNNFSFRKGLYFQGFYSALALNLSLIISRAFITSTTYVLGFSACPSAHEKTPTGAFILSWHL